MKKLSVCIGAILALGVLAGCGSTNGTTDGGTAATALVTFTDSGCKNYKSEALTAGLGASGHALLTVDGTSYDGLTCISWDATGDTLKVDCLNFTGGCGVPWQGSVRVGEGNALNLFARHELELVGGILECSGAACGSCSYDWSYEVRGVDPSKDCPLALQSGPPCGRTHDYELTLPLAAAKKGIVCRYTLSTWGIHSTGNLHEPCAMTEAERDHLAPCGDGFVCTRMNEDVNICLATCAADADCPLDGLLKCDGGVCRLKETW